MQSYTIGELARSVGVPVSTVRYYERVGLLKADFRTGGNYRGYTATSMDRLRFIRSAQATGLSLQDVETLLNLTCSTKPPCDEVLSLMRHRLEEIRTRIEELRHVETVLARSLERCCQGDDRDLCDDVCRLNCTDGVACRPPRKKSRQPA